MISSSALVDLSAGGDCHLGELCIVETLSSFLLLLCDMLTNITMLRPVAQARGFAVFQFRSKSADHDLVAFDC